MKQTSEEGEMMFFKWVGTITIIVVSLVVVLSIILAFFKFNGARNIFTDADVLNFQLILLQLVLTIMTFGGGVLVFIGWKTIIRASKNTAINTAKNTTTEYLENNLEELIKETKDIKTKPKAPEDEEEVDDRI